MKGFYVQWNFSRLLQIEKQNESFQKDRVWSSIAVKSEQIWPKSNSFCFSYAYDMAEIKNKQTAREIARQMCKHNNGNA